ncbi:hypothetical protein H9W90_09960 [Polaribacter pectinis]|uniref:Uncharacterized protein n=1 Tax=Polaribacter pectinis TaxID=2738844 RepID=A0A7G9L7C1_9FLAO|nr:hypothetical protein [Polaribacter pectinis]QNM84520.1 hypothetical protein H9W90_09960 [Polaribacter pectinis]
MRNLRKTIILSFLIILMFGFNSCKRNSSNEWIKAGDKPDSYIISFDNSIFQNGEKSSYIESIEPEINGFGTLMQTCNAKEYLGKKVKMSGFIKTENISDWVGMWLRIDPIKSPSSEYFDNMRDKQIKGTTNWTKYEIILDIPTNSNSMNFGVLIYGTGKVWFDNLSFEIVGKSTEKFNDSLNIGISNKLLPKPTNLDFEE